MQGIELSEVLDEYDRLRPLYKSFAAQVAYVLEHTLRSAGVDLHLVDKRAKTTESLADKLRRPDKQYQNPMNEIDDLAGVRVIVNYVDTIDTVLATCRSLFEVFEERSRDMRTSPTEFGYESAHLVVAIGDDRRRLLEWAPFKDLRLEIQVRTVVQHAWAVVSHSLQYKTELDVPIKLRRRLARVSALLELADDEFSMIAMLHKGLDQNLREQSVVSPTWDAPIDIASARILLESDAAVREIEDEARALGFQVWDVGRRETTASELVAAATAANITSITDLRDLLNRDKAKRREFLRLALEKSQGSWTVDADFLTALLVIWRHPELFTRALLVDSWDWGEKVADTVLDAATDATPS